MSGQWGKNIPEGLAKLASVIIQSLVYAGNTRGTLKLQGLIQLRSLCFVLLHKFCVFLAESGTQCTL